MTHQDDWKEARQMRGLLRLYGVKRVFVLGAGFSALQGMPLTNDLLKDTHAVARTKRWFLGPEHGESPNGQADWLIKELNWYFPMDEIDHDSIVSRTLPKGLDVEKFLSYASASSAFIHGTSRRWNRQGDDKFVAFFKQWLGEAILLRQSATEIHPIYNRFARLLANSVVLTFNWDTVLEEALEANGLGYSYDLPSTFENGRVPLIKMHGSADWFSMPSSLDKEQWMSFRRVSKFFPGCYRARGNVLAYYGKNLTPWIVIPSFDKVSQVLRLGDLWQTPWMFLQDKLEVVVIGFSMRPDDFHTRAFLYPQLVAGTRDGSLSVKVVDLAVSQGQKERIRQRFTGVTNCQFFFGGFGNRALDFIAA